MNTITVRGLRTACLSRDIHIQSRVWGNRVSARQKRYIDHHLRPTTDSQVLLYHLQHRCASSSTVSPRTSSNPATTPSTPSKLSKVNGPPTTLPAPLSIPTREPSQSAPKYYFTLGKAFLAFYKTGVKNIYTNFQASRKIQAQIDSANPPNSSLLTSARSGLLSRHDFQLLVRNWHDVKRVPIFALVFMICGEFTPLVVIALSGVVPWTCRIPRQIENDRKKLERRRGVSFRNLTMEPPKEKGVEGLQRMQLLHISWSLGLSSSVWDWLGGQLPGLPTGILRRKVKKRVEYLDVDDSLITKCGGVKEMDIEEVKLALVERGIDVLGKKDGDLKADLSSWLRSREKVPIERLLLTRPSVWPVRPKAQ